MHDSITGQLAVGRYVLHVGEPPGAQIREASRAERAHFRPRPTPVLVRPRLIRGLVDRQLEVASAISALDAGLPVEVSGDAGLGKTAILRHLAHHPRADSFVDGIVYLPVRHQSPADLQQLLFEAFYESEEICKPTDAEILRGLHDKQALILLDDVRLTQDELEQVLDSAPRAAFAVATRERCLWGEVRSIDLKGLPAEPAMQLLEREIERELDTAERSTGERLCAVLGGNPLRIRQAAALARERGLTDEGWARDVTPDNLITQLIASTDDRQRRALLALTALPAAPLQVQDISGIAEIVDLEPSLMTLVRRGLVVRSHARHQLAAGVADRLRRTDDLNPWVNRAITYFTAWAERYRRNPEKLLEASETLLRAQQCAAELRRSGEALRLGQLLERALVLDGRWGAWAVALERCLAAAKTLGDRPAEAWALHEIGIRALCLGETAAARRSLGQAAALRETLGDADGAAASRRNLGLVVAPMSSSPRDRSPAADEGLDLDLLPLRNEIQLTLPGQKTHTFAAVALTALLLTVVSGLAYSTTAAGQSWRSWILDSGSSLRDGVADAMARGRRNPPPPVLPPTPSPQAATDVPVEPVVSAAPASVSREGASILIFTARPGSIPTEGRTTLCYAVSGAFDATIEPGIGEVEPTSTLTCHRVAPRRTTTYQLTAFGRDGRQVSQRVVIIVR